MLDLWILLFFVFIATYLGILQITAEGLYSRRQLPLLAVTILIVYMCVLGFVGVIYYYTEFDVHIIYGTIMVCAFAAVLYLMSFVYKYRKEMNKSVLSLMLVYLAIMLYLTLGMRIGGNNEWTKVTRLSPFMGVREFIRTGAVKNLRHFGQNIIVFIPFGIMVPLINPKRLEKISYAALFGFIYSAGIESLQMLSHLGMFDVDDIIGNTLGAILGYMLCMMVVKIEKNWKIV